MSASPLRIVLTDPHSQGGGQRTYLAHLMQRFRGMGHHVTMCCRPGSMLAGAAAEAECEVLDRFNFPRGFKPPGLAADLRRMVRLIRLEQPDILHVNNSQDHWLVAAANRWLGRPATLLRTRHNTYPVKDSWPNRVLNRRWTDYQIVVCHAVRRDLMKLRSFDPGRMCTVHNGVDSARFAPAPETRARMRALFGYAEKDVVAGIAARLVKAKGHEFLLRAVAQIADSYPDLRLLILGTGVLEEDLKRLAEALGVMDRVQFAGQRDDIAECVQAMDIGVQPSIGTDTSSFSLKEQMAAGKPVIASDYGGLTEIVSDGVEGLVVPAGTVNPLAAAMRRLIDSPESRAKMGAAGRARVDREFSLDHFAARTLEAYHKAIELHRESTAHR